MYADVLTCAIYVGGIKFLRYSSGADMQEHQQAGGYMDVGRGEEGSTNASGYMDVAGTNSNSNSNSNSGSGASSNTAGYMDVTTGGGDGGGAGFGGFGSSSDEEV